MNKHGSKWIRRSTRLAIYIRDGFECGYCGTDLRDAEPWFVTLDHVVAKEMGGSNEPTNLITACKICNELKNDQSVVDFCALNHYDLMKVKRQLEKPLNRKLANSLLKEHKGSVMTLDKRVLVS